MSTAGTMSIDGDGELFAGRPQDQRPRWIGSANLSSYMEDMTTCEPPEYVVTGSAFEAPITRFGNEMEWGWTMFTGHYVSSDEAYGGTGALTFRVPFSPRFSFDGEFHKSASCGFEPSTYTEEVVSLADQYTLPTFGTFPLAADGTFHRTVEQEFEGTTEISGRFWSEGGVQRFTFTETWTSPPEGYSEAAITQSYSLDLTCTSGSCVPNYNDPYPRTVSMQLRKHLVASGWVQSAADCMFEVPVRIQRKFPSGWATVARGRTDGNSNFRIALRDRPGRYRAKTPAMTVTGGDGITIPCASEVSPTMAHSSH